MGVEIVESGDTVTVVIEVDTSAFEAAMRAPRIQPMIPDAFAADLAWVRRSLALTADDVRQAFANLP